MVTNRQEKENEAHGNASQSGRSQRADAQRNLLTVLAAAKEIFAEAGLDAPVRSIAERAGVGVGTLYRHYPRRADLVAAVFRQELDACADAAAALAAKYPPFEALELWMDRFVDLAATKHGMAQALFSGDAAYADLPQRREERLRPAFRRLFDAALAAGVIRTDIEPDEFLNAAASLCASAAAQPDHARKLVGLLVRGLHVSPQSG